MKNRNSVCFVDGRWYYRLLHHNTNGLVTTTDTLMIQKTRWCLSPNVASLNRQQQQQCTVGIASFSKHSSSFSMDRKSVLYNNNDPNEYSVILSLSESVTTTPTTTTSTTSFEPILNIPAFSVFLLIAMIFAYLQYRITAIEQASKRRTIALNELKAIKLKALTSIGIDSIDPNDVKEAIETYRKQYDEVEKLREIIPGVRIIQPPSQSNSRRIMDDNEKAAQQYLGIMPVTDQVNDNNNIDRKSSVGEDEKSNKGFTTIQLAVLTFIVFSQCCLLFFLSLDPLTSNNVLDMIDSVTEDENTK